MLRPIDRPYIFTGLTDIKLPKTTKVAPTAGSDALSCISLTVMPMVRL